MRDLPETSQSLLVRLRDTADSHAWAEFVEIYRPAVYRFARRRGFQDADAHDLVQRVMVSVSSAVANWDGAAGNGRFRAWLSRISRNAAVDAVRRIRPDAARGGTSMLQRLNGQPASCESVDDAIEHEYRREIFRRAARRVQSEVEEASWAAFWLTTVLEVSVAEAAERLSKSIGSVYTARSRVMRRLQSKVREYEMQWELPDAS